MSWRRFKRLFDWYLIKRSIKFWWQRRTRGWDDSETWSLDYSLAKVILPRLKRLKQLNMGYPPELTAEEWNVILDKMIVFFEFAASERRFDLDIGPDEWEQYQEGRVLFGKWYLDLWW